MSMFLSQEEIVELTGKKRRPAQVSALNMMGIEHKVNADGRVIVLTSHIENVFGGNMKTRLESKNTKQQPDWGAI